MTELLWENDTVFLIVAERADQSPQYYYEFVQIDREDMKKTARISYTSSSYRYEIFDGQIVIPE